MENYKLKIHEYIYSHKDEITEFLSRLISYRSVEESALDGMPFGKPCADVLAEFLSECEKFGFKTKNFANYAAHADMNDYPPYLGILCHLDVVPEGSGWSSDPFCMEERNGRIYGRGAIDDKGPAAAALFAMKCVKDLNVPINKGIRIIVGCNEENGSADMEYYRRHEKFPERLVTPDGNYPVINIEKGMLRCKITSEELHPDIIEIHGGDVINAVPDICTVKLKNITAKDIQKFAEGINVKELSSQEKKGYTEITVKGKREHASTPENGINAVTAMLSLLGRIYGGKVKALSDIFKAGETDGTSAGLKCSDDKSGALTLVLSVINYENGHLDAYCDSRFPVSKTLGSISGKLTDTLKENGFNGEIILGNEPHYVDGESDFIKMLLKVYEDVTGEKGECIAIGGGTYVHDTENGVAFGAEFPNEDNHMHGADESIKTESLLKNAEIYANLICEAGK